MASLKVDVFLPKSNARFKAHKQRFVNNSRHPRKLVRLMKPQNNGRAGPLGVNDSGSGFHGEKIALTHVFHLTKTLIREK